MIQTVINDAKNNFRWLDVVMPTGDELARIAEEFHLQPTTVQDCLQPEHLPKFEKFEDALFLICRAYDELSNRDADTVQELTRKTAIFWSEKFLITVHRVDQIFIRQRREHWSGCTEAPAKAATAILTELLKAILGTYENPLESATDQLDEIETEVFLSQSAPQMIETLFLLKRKATIIKKMLFLTREILTTLAPEIKGWKSSLQDLQETSDHLFFMTDQLYDNATNLLNLHISLSSHRTNEVVRLLTLFSVFFMPLTFMVGIYGMNFKFMPELEKQWGYPAVWLFMLLVTLSIFLWFKRKKWL
jgi:magnesium transporter